MAENKLYIHDIPIDKFIKYYNYNKLNSVRLEEHKTYIRENVKAIKIENDNSRELKPNVYLNKQKKNFKEILTNQVQGENYSFFNKNTLLSFTQDVLHKLRLYSESTERWTKNRLSKYAQLLKLMGKPEFIDPKYCTIYFSMKKRETQQPNVILQNLLTERDFEAYYQQLKENGDVSIKTCVGSDSEHKAVYYTFTDLYKQILSLTNSASFNLLDNEYTKSFINLVLYGKRQEFVRVDVTEEDGNTVTNLHRNEVEEVTMSYYPELKDELKEILLREDSTLTSSETDEDDESAINDRHLISIILSDTGFDEFKDLAKKVAEIDPNIIDYLSDLDEDGNNINRDIYFYIANYKKYGSISEFEKADKLTKYNNKLNIFKDNITSSSFKNNLTVIENEVEETTSTNIFNKADFKDEIGTRTQFINLFTEMYHTKNYDDHKKFKIIYENFYEQKLDILDETMKKNISTEDYISVNFNTDYDDNKTVFNNLLKLKLTEVEDWGC